MCGEMQKYRCTSVLASRQVRDAAFATSAVLASAAAQIRSQGAGTERRREVGVLTGAGDDVGGEHADATALAPQAAPAAQQPGPAGQQAPAAGQPAELASALPAWRAAADRGLPSGLALLTALAGGLVLAAAFPPVGAWPLAAVGPALLVVALWRRSLRGSLAVGLVFGLAFFVPLLAWLVNVAWYVWAALAVVEAVMFAVLAVGQRLLLNLRAWPLAAAGWWVAAEALRDRWPFGGFPWGRLAMSQAASPAGPWVAIGGAPWLTFLLAIC